METAAENGSALREPGDGAGSRAGSTLPEQGSSRRRFLVGGGLALGAGVLAACTDAGNGSGAAGGDGGTQGGNSLLDSIPQAGVARVGVDLTFPPLQYRDPSTDEPTGYMIELTKRMISDLEAEPEWVEVPFAQLFAAQASGRFDFGGIAATILPSRGLQVLFASEPAFIESLVILLRPGFTINDTDELDGDGVTLAVQVGSSQEAAAPLLFPRATLKSLENQPAIQDVASGRSDAMLLSEFNIKEAVDANPGLTVFPGPPVFVDYNTYFMPADDVRFQQWVSRWIQYQTSHGVLEGLWNQYVGEDARALDLPTQAVSSPYVR